MISDINSISSDTHVNTDVCIVGAGAAGITLALELIDSGLSVLLLESGNFNFDQITQNLYSGAIEDNLPPIPLTALRLRYFGGTTNHWGGHCAPFDSIDFQKREWLQNCEWPITRAELEPYYKKAQEIIELGPYQYDAEHWYKDNKDIFDLSGTELRNSLLQMNGQRFGSRYRNKLDDSKNITVLLNSNLTNIHVNDSFDAITSLEVRSIGGAFLSVTPKQTVLACGGIENARLLMNSSFDKKLDKIGRYYSFHPRIKTARIALSNLLEKKNSPYDWTSVNNTLSRTLLSLSAKHQKRAGLPNHAALLQIVTRENLESYSALKRLRGRVTADHEARGFFDDVATFLSDIGGAREQWKNRHGNTKRSEFSVVTYMDQVPNPDSRITLGEEKDSLGLRKSNVSWRCFDFERESIVEFNKQVAIGLGSANIGRLQIDTQLNDKKHFDELMRRESGGGHQIGTTRMSFSAENGVVDKNCKLHGVENLYCAGSSVFPTTSWVNPTMTIVALASRLASHLKKLIE